MVCVLRFVGVWKKQSDKIAAQPGRTNFNAKIYLALSMSRKFKKKFTKTTRVSCDFASPRLILLILSFYQLQKQHNLRPL